MIPLKAQLEDLIIIRKIDDKQSLTLKTNAGIQRTPVVESVSGYKFVATIGGYGNGYTGLLVAQNGWVCNCNSFETTWTGITWINVYIKN